MAKKKKTKKKKSTAKRKPAKKKGLKRKPVRKKKTAPKSKKKTVKKAAKTPKLPAEPVGRVTHYFPHVKATAVMIERDGIRAGDTLYFKGHTTNFKQKVVSMQVEHQPVERASPGDEIGIRVNSRTREHDLVFKL